jgi:GAF domain-containing protein
LVLLLVGRISNYLELDFLLRGNMSYLTVDPLARCTDIQPIVDWLLHRAIDLSQTSFGNVQLMSWTAGYLEITAQLGFDEAFLNFFERVRIEDGSACARALRNREAIVIEDIMADDEFSPRRQVVSQAGIRAVQSTPIMSSSGAFLGVMSTHFAAPHRPTRIEQRELQHTAQIAANAFIRVGASRHSLHERITSSLMLIDQSRKHIGQADRLLVLSRGACAQSAMLDLDVS